MVKFKSHDKAKGLIICFGSGDSKFTVKFINQYAMVNDEKAKIMRADPRHHPGVFQEVIEEKFDKKNPKITLDK